MKEDSADQSRNQTAPRKWQPNFTVAFFSIFGLALVVFAWQSLTPRMPGMSGMSMSPSDSPSSMAGMDMGPQPNGSANVAANTLAVLGGDRHALMVADDGRLFYGQHAGVQVSADGGATWSAPRGGGDAMGIGVAGEKLYLAGHDFFSVSTDGGRSWRNLSVGNLPGTDIHGFAVAPNGWLYANLAGRGLYRSTDGGASWIAVSQATLNAMTLQAGQGSPPWLYANTMDQGIIRSQDGGRTWQSLTSAIEGSPTAFAEDAKRGAVLVATADGKLLRTSNNGDAWTALTAPEPLLLLTVSPRQPTLIYAVGSSGQVYRSDDGGTSWNGG